MSEIETVTIDLPRAMAAELQRSVESGEFASRSAAVQAALAEWRQTHASSDFSTEELRRLTAEGIASGLSSIGSMADLKREARRRLACRQP